MQMQSTVHRGAIAVSGALVVVAAGVAPASASGSSTFQRDIDAVRATGVSGVIGEADTERGTVRAKAGVADLRTGRPMRNGSYFRAGSNTKTYVATVVLQLAGEGRLRLDDTVDKWLPGVVKGNGNDGTKITLRNLLQHTSGLHNYSDELPMDTPEAFYAHRFDHHTPEDLVASAMQHKPNFEPGAKWDYTNTGYLLLGMVIKKVTGRSWDREVQDRVLRPLGLRDTSFAGRRYGLPQPSARGYQQFTPGGKLYDVTEMDLGWGSSAGEIITTTTDLNRFFRGLIGGRLLKPAQLKEMQRTVPTGITNDPFAGSRYGLGLFWFPLKCSKAGVWGHGGDTPGFMTRDAVTPDGRRAVSVSISAQLADDTGKQDYAAVKAMENVFCA